MVIFHVAQMVEKEACNLWVAGLNLASVLLFISFVEFYKCIFGANVHVIEFENLKAVVVIII